MIGIGAKFRPGERLHFDKHRVSYLRADFSTSTLRKDEHVWSLIFLGPERGDNPHSAAAQKAQVAVCFVLGTPQRQGIANGCQWMYAN